AEGVGDGRVWMHHAETRVVEKHKPNVGRESALPAELAQDVFAGGDHGMGQGLDRAVALTLGREIDDAVLREIHLPRLAMRAQELPRMVAPCDGHGVKAERSEALERRGRAGLGEVPRVGVDGLVAHSACLASGLQTGSRWRTNAILFGFF